MSTHTPKLPQNTTGHVSTIYGPVKSWRYGQSLGVDLIRDISTCSFNCIYCQLGNIQQRTAQRQVFVPTEQVMADLEASDWQQADIITFSGSGEPTLALNLGDCIAQMKAKTGKPVLVLTNATLLGDADVVAQLQAADQVAVKLDAATDEGLQQMNRPVDGVTLAAIVSNAKAFKQQYNGKMALQCMFMPTNLACVNDLAALIKEIGPDEVQLNTPKRPYPTSWHVTSRGNHVENPEYETRQLKTVSLEQALAIEAALKEQTGLPVLSIYPKQ